MDTCLGECCANVVKIVDLSIVSQDGTVDGHRLVTRMGWVHNREPAMAEKHAGGNIMPFTTTVGTTMGERGSTFPSKFDISRSEGPIIEKAEDAAHEWLIDSDRRLRVVGVKVSEFLHLGHLLETRVSDKVAFRHA